MRIDAIAVGKNPPDDVNVLIEVPPVSRSSLAVPSHELTRRYDNVVNYSDLPEITLEQIEHFFEHYKDLEPGKWVKIGGWHGADTARKLIVEGIERARTGG